MSASKKAGAAKEAIIPERDEAYAEITRMGQVAAEFRHGLEEKAQTLRQV